MHFFHLVVPNPQIYYLLFHYKVFLKRLRLFHNVSIF